MEGVGAIFQSFLRERSSGLLFGGARSVRRRSEEQAAAEGLEHELIPQLSRVANSVIARCGRILLSSPKDLQQNFENEMPDDIKELSSYARNLLEYCSYKTLQVAIEDQRYLTDKEFRRLTYDMMLAWETPDSKDESTPKASSKLDIEDEDGGAFFYISSTSMAAQVDYKQTVGRDAFARIAPACPAVADAITVHNLFDALTNSSGGQLHFLLYDKYLGSLDKVFKSAKLMSAFSYTPNLQLVEGEVILDTDGTLPTQVLQHIGISAWPGRLTLTSRAIYFEPLGVGSYDKPIVYDLATDLKQVIKPELIGPLGSRLFDKAVMYKSSALGEPVYFEFPELKGHARRDYWLTSILEILHVHKFIRKFDLDKIQQAEALSKAIIGIFQQRAVRDVFHIFPSDSKTILPFSLCEKLPRGDDILDALHQHLEFLNIERLSSLHKDSLDAKPQRCLLPSSLLSLSRKGFSLLKETERFNDSGSLASHLFIGNKSPLEEAVKESICYSGKAETARASVEQVKVDGIDTNLAVMKELLFPLIESCRQVHFLSTWEDPFRSTVFLFLTIFAMYRGWTRYILPSVFIFFGILMLWYKHVRKEKQLEAFKIATPPSKNPVEQLMILQEAISRLETFVQAGNIILLKLRALLVAAVPETSERVAAALIVMGASFVFIPFEYVVFSMLLEAYTREMPLRRHSSEKLIRRIREWWVCIPAAPVKLVRPEDDKKRR